MLGLINNIDNVTCNCLRITSIGIGFLGKSGIFDSYVELLDMKGKSPLGFEYEIREMFTSLFQEHKKLIEINDRASEVYEDLRSYSVRFEIIDADIQNLKNTIDHLKKNATKSLTIQTLIRRKSVKRVEIWNVCKC